jgi:hypothetical protein
MSPAEDSAVTERDIFLALLDFSRDARALATAASS